MSGRPSIADLVIQFGGLRISVSSNEAPGPAASSAAPSSPAGSFVLVEAPTDSPQALTGPLAGEATEPSGDPTGTSASEDFLAATTAEELGALRLGPLDHLARGLKAVGDWTAEARIARAYRAGLSAGALFRDEREWLHSSPALGARNRYYIVLQCVAVPAGFVTQSFATFQAHVQRDRHGRLEHNCICHGFPSRSETEAYLFGADLPWPREL